VTDPRAPLPDARALQPVAAVPRSGAGVSGRHLVLGLMALGLVAALVGIGYQRRQTRGCLAFYGPEMARAITSARHVELWTGLRQGSDARHVVATARLDVSAAKGLVHLRRGLVEDANFRPLAGASPQTTAPAWAYALVFSPEPVSRAGNGTREGVVAVLFDGDATGTPRWLCVAGRPGQMPIGRIGPGIRSWFGVTVGSRGASGR